MKVLFPTVTFYPAQIGGPNNTLLWHCTYLKANGIAPIIVTSDLGIGSNMDVKLGVWKKKSFGQIVYYRDYSQNFPIKVIFQTLKKVRLVDVIHFNGMYNRVSLWLIFILAALGKPIVLSPRGELFPDAIGRKSFSKKLVLFFYKLIKSRLVFHATSTDERNNIRDRLGNVRIVVQANFISAIYKKKKGLVNRDLLFLGRINPIKNIHLLIEAAAKSEQFWKSDSKIILAGQARLKYEITYLNELEDLIDKMGMTERVVFLGHVENERKERLLQDSFFLVLPSKSENFGNVVVESLINGTPVIASMGTPWEALNQYSAGLWIDVDDLRATINRVLGLTEKEYLSYTENAISLVKSLYDVRSLENKWVEIYEGVARNKLKSSLEKVVGRNYATSNILSN